MWKTFFVSPLAGALAAILGWFGALTMIDGMQPSTFESLQFGHGGLFIGCAAVVAVIMLLIGGTTVEPLVVAVSAGVGVFLLWDERTLPFKTENLTERSSEGYWFAVTMMVVVFILLLMGLRVARETNTRAGR